MKRLFLLTIVSFSALLLSCSKSHHGPESPQEDILNYKADSYTHKGLELHYRIVTNHLQQPTIGYDPNKVVIYLHEESFKGINNSSQLNDPAVDRIVKFLLKNDYNFAFIVPQCPSGKSWCDEDILEVLDYLLYELKYKKQYGNKVIALGSGEGATGLWKLASDYPGIFYSIMVCGGNPLELKEWSFNEYMVKQCIVIGEEDPTTDRAKIESFIEKLTYRDDEKSLRFDVEKGWNHKKTCSDSYSNERLDYFFTPHILSI